MLLIDSIGANLIVWFGSEKWYIKHLGFFSHYFPPAKGWSTYYLLVVLIMGAILYKSGVLTF